MLARQTQDPVREVIYRTKGRTSGPITRLVNPSDLGDLIKPFVFLDLAVFDSGPRTPMERLWHSPLRHRHRDRDARGRCTLPDCSASDDVPPRGPEGRRTLDL